MGVGIQVAGFLPGCISGDLGSHDERVGTKERPTSVSCFRRHIGGMMRCLRGRRSHERVIAIRVIVVVPVSSRVEYSGVRGRLELGSLERKWPSLPRQVSPHTPEPAPTT